MATLPRLHRDLARNALGLPNIRRESCRNRYSATLESAEHKEWTALVALDYAERINGFRDERGGGSDLFFLTLFGAKLALNPEERLDMEDFPEDRLAVERD